MSIFMLMAAFALFIIGILIMRQGYGKLHQYHLIHDTPTSKIRSIAMGLVELKGRPYSHEYLKTPYSWSQCVYYQFTTYEYTIRDIRNPVLSRGWAHLRDGKADIPFYASDGTGHVLINPTGAEYKVRLQKVLYMPRSGDKAKLKFRNLLKKWFFGKYKSFKMTETGFYEFNPREKIPFRFRLGDRLIHEHYICAEDDLYVMGTAKNDEKVHNMTVVEKGETEPTFIIANKSESKLLVEKKAIAFGWYAVSAFVLLTSGFLFVLSFIFV